MDKYRLQILLEQDKNGRFIASCPSLEGCIYRAKTAKEAVEKVRRMIETAIQKMDAEKINFNHQSPKIVEVRSLDMAV